MWHVTVSGPYNFWGVRVMGEFHSQVRAQRCARLTWAMIDKKPYRREGNRPGYLVSVKQGKAPEVQVKQEVIRPELVGCLGRG